MDLARRPAPFRIETERLVLRCPELTDVDLVQEAVSESIESLRPWMPWVEGEPVAREQRLVERHCVTRACRCTLTSPHAPHS